MGRLFTVFAAALLASGALCAAAPEKEPTAEEILDGTAPTGEYVQKEKCIVSMRIKRTEVLSDRFILFHLNGNELWLARLPQRCSGLTPRSKLVFDKTNDRMCQWDSVRTIQQEDTPTPQYGPRCMLPQFETVTVEQVEQLKKEIVSERYRTSKPSKPAQQ